MPDATPDVRFVIAYPDEFRGCEPGQGVVAGDRDEPFCPDRHADRIAFRGGPLVVPQDRGPEDTTISVEQDEAMHLSREPDGVDVCPSRPGRGHDRADRRDRPCPPKVRILLAPERVRDPEPVFRCPDPADGTRLVDEDGLRGGRRDVDPEDEPHGQRPAPVSIGSRSAAQMRWFTRVSRSSWWPDTGLGSISPDATFASSDASNSWPSRIARPSGPSQPA